MSLTGILDVLAGDPAVAALIAAARERGQHRARRHRSARAAAPLVAALAAAEPAGAARPVLAVTATGREAEDLAAALRCFLPADAVAEFPAWETLPHERLSPAQRHRRPPARRAAPARPPRAPDDAAAHGAGLASWSRRSAPCCSRWSAGLGDLEPVRAAARATTSTSTDVVERLAAAAYTRVDLVERRGEFAVRGGILDVFPPTEEHPLRVEFWGDTVEEIRWFTVADQRSLEVAEHGLWAPPCRELLLTDEVRGAGRGRSAEQLPGAADMLGQARRGHRRRGHGVAGARCWSTAWSCCSTCCPTAALRRRRATRSGSAPGRTTWSRPARSSSRPRWASAAGAATPADRPRPVAGHRVLPRRSPTSASTRSSAGIAVVDAVAVRGGRRGRDRPVRRATTATTPCCATSALAGRRAPTAATPTAPSPTCSVAADGWRRRAGHRGARPGAARGRGARRRRRRRPGSAPTSPRRRRPASCTSPPAASAAASSRAALQLAVAHRDRPHRPRGGASHRGHAADAEPAPQRRRPAAAAARRLRRARAARRRPVRRDGAAHRRRAPTREYLVIEYAPSKRGQPGDRLFVPTDQLDQVTRYVGGEAPTPAPDRRRRLGQDQGPGRARRSRRSPRELIRLYSRADGDRRARVRPGHPVAARARGRLPVRRDARPARRRSTRSRPTWRSRSRWTG